MIARLYLAILTFSQNWGWNSHFSQLQIYIWPYMTLFFDLVISRKYNLHLAILTYFSQLCLIKSNSEKKTISLEIASLYIIILNL